MEIRKCVLCRNGEIVRELFSIISSPQKHEKHRREKNKFSVCLVNAKRMVACVIQSTETHVRNHEEHFYKAETFLQVIKFVNIITRNKCKRSHWYSASLTFPSLTQHRESNAGLTMGHRLRRWPSIKPALDGRLVFSGNTTLSCKAKKKVSANVTIR